MKITFAVVTTFLHGFLAKPTVAFVLSDRACGASSKTERNKMNWASTKPTILSRSIGDQLWRLQLLSFQQLSLPITLLKLLLLQTAQDPSTASNTPRLDIRPADWHLLCACSFRMTVIAMESGGLLVYSAVAATRQCLSLLQPLMDQFGPIRYIVLLCVAHISALLSSLQQHVWLRNTLGLLTTGQFLRFAANKTQVRRRKSKEFGMIQIISLP